MLFVHKQLKKNRLSTQMKHKNCFNNAIIKIIQQFINKNVNKTTFIVDKGDK